MSILAYDVDVDANQLQALKAKPALVWEMKRDPALNVGLGGARVFSPAEVKLIAVSFSNFKPADLRRHFDRKEMTRYRVGDMGWMEEPDTVFDDMLAPSFTKVSDFYQRAARLQHYVLVIYQ